MNNQIKEQEIVMNEVPELALVKVRKTDDPEYFKKYYTNNRQKFLSKAKTLIKCPDCQKVVSTGHLKRHKLSRDHLKAIEPLV